MRACARVCVREREGGGLEEVEKAEEPGDVEEVEED